MDWMNQSEHGFSLFTSLYSQPSYIQQRKCGIVYLTAWQVDACR